MGIVTVQATTGGDTVAFAPTMTVGPGIVVDPATTPGVAVALTTGVGIVTAPMTTAAVAVALTTGPGW